VIPHGLCFFEERATQLPAFGAVDETLLVCATTRLAAAARMKHLLVWAKAALARDPFRPFVQAVNPVPRLGDAPLIRNAF
jgi:hypothetical protein